MKGHERRELTEGRVSGGEVEKRGHHGLKTEPGKMFSCMRVNLRESGEKDNGFTPEGCEGRPLLEAGGGHHHKSFPYAHHPGRRIELLNTLFGGEGTSPTERKKQNTV